MESKKGIHIKKVQGDVVISQNQTDGVTAHKVGTDDESPSKRSILKRFGWWIASVASLVTIMGYLGLSPKQKEKSMDQKSAQSPISFRDVSGDVVISQNQSGGQVAHTINNFGPHKRTVDSNMRNKILNVLAQSKPGRIGFASTQGDVEAHEFKQQIMEVFRSADWEVQDMQIFMFFAEAKGFVVTIPFNASEQGLPQIVTHALSQTGNPVSGNRGDMANECGIYVQVWHAP